MEVSLLISCRVPTYLMSDLEMSEMRDLGRAGVLELACLRRRDAGGGGDGDARGGRTHPMYSDILRGLVGETGEGGWAGGGVGWWL